MNINFNRNFCQNIKMSSPQISDLIAFSIIIILIILSYVIKDPNLKFVAYIFIILLLIWRAIVFIQRAIDLNFKLGKNVQQFQ
jgi:ABC-type polysaccharide/polyol phosphate export permease